MANRRTEPDRRPTKAERREEARLQRAEIQRKMARRKRNRTLIVGVLIGAIAVGVAVVAFEKNKGVTTANGTHVDSPEQLLAQATTAAKTAGCSDVRTTEPFNPDNRTGTVPLPPEADIDRDHIGTTYDPTPPPLSAYASTPPASGPHDPTPLAAGVYDSPPSIYATIHSLEHAAAIIWYDPTSARRAQGLLPGADREGRQDHRRALHLSERRRLGRAPEERRDGARVVAPARNVRPGESSRRVRVQLEVRVPALPGADVPGRGPGADGRDRLAR